MKTIRHKHGKEIYLFFDAELSQNLRLRIMPASIAGRDTELYSHVMRVIRKEGDDWRSLGQSGIRIGKIKEIKKALVACIKDPNKTIEIKMTNERILKLGSEGRMIIPVCPQDIELPQSKEGMIEMEKAISSAISEMRNDKNSA